jgi:hypothetical protein
MSPTEINAFKHEQRHARRVNQEHAEADMNAVAAERALKPAPSVNPGAPAAGARPVKSPRRADKPAEPTGSPRADVRLESPAQADRTGAAPAVRRGVSRMCPNRANP